MSRITTEEGLENAFIKLLKGWQAQGKPVFQFKGNPTFDKGIVDRLVCYYGIFVAIELKKPGRITHPDGTRKKTFRPSSPTEALQALFIDEVRRGKGYGDFFDNLEEIVKFFEMIHEKECLN
ncbi:MAG: hypothetical protein J0I20_33820 [Chloroflexi bacterium]|nr:hypothetical protein [Chloroflexota bacterium]OJW05560.1 MAG: hypothetical protein BGO39_02785 [Chloroflexi bacterium 54-19]